MKRALLITSLIAALSLSGCIISGDEDSYKTPELFCAMADYAPCSFSYYVQENQALNDCDGSVLEALKSIKTYESISEISDKSDRYFCYENWVPATSGPNIARMTVYDNGYLEIYRKQSLGVGHSFCYSFDVALALSLNDLVFGKIEYANQAAKEAKENAESYASIENFFADAKKQDFVYSIAWNDQRSYDFKAYSDIVERMEGPEYTPLEAAPDFMTTSFRYSTSHDWNPSFDWMFILGAEYDIVEICYLFQDALQREYALPLYFSIDKAAGAALFNYVIDIAIRTNINGQ